MQVTKVNRQLQQSSHFVAPEVTYVCCYVQLYIVCSHCPTIGATEGQHLLEILVQVGHPHEYIMRILQSIFRDAACMIANQLRMAQCIEVTAYPDTVFRIGATLHVGFAESSVAILVELLEASEHGAE